MKNDNLKSKINRLKNEIQDIISRSPVKTDLEHAISTRKWVLRLKPNADLVLQIAALAHDIERGLQKAESQKSINRKENFRNYYRCNEIHSQKSAKIIVNILEKYQFNKNFIAKVKRLVLRHEFGGDKESNILMDADSLSFFERNFDGYLKKYGQKKAEKKIKFMYSRMSEKAKKLSFKIKFQNTGLKKLFAEVINGK
ncbi:MAG: DUF4202 family protein [Patescibacteria group bacterium]|nr:DUF4202 family protein [Patescibacteria group bacterium]MDD4610459.1 DUF4202 family protein [Patescibacteria group bacterium]